MITNLYPPYYLGGYELRCRTVVEGLQQRGHTVFVLTSDYGVEAREIPVSSFEAADTAVWRALRFYWFTSPDLWTIYRSELSNHRYLRHVVRTFRPDVINIWNFGGLGLSLLSHVQAYHIPVVFHFDDDWFLKEFTRDYWLNYCANEHPINILRTAWRLSRQKAETSSMSSQNETQVSVSSEQELSGSAPLQAHISGLKRGYHKFLRYIPKSLISQAVRKWMVRYLPIAPEEIDLQHACFISGFRKQQYVDAGLPVKNARVIYGGIDTGRFVSSSSSRRTPEKQIKLLCLSQLYKGKGIHTAIEALALLHQQGYRHLTLSIAGEEVNGSAYTEYLKQQAGRSKQLNRAIRFLGKIPYDDVPSVYQAHDFFIAPSIIPEGFPLTLVEAMASGLVVFTSATGGAQEAIRHNHDGMVFSAGMPDSLAAQIEFVGKTPELQQSLSQNAKKKACEFFDRQTMISNIEAYLKDSVL